MSKILDKRELGKNRSSSNRERFIRRYNSNIKETIKDAIKNNNIADINKGKTTIRVKRKDLTEPEFQSDSKTGNRSIIHPGNKDYVSGDVINKPPQGGGGGGNQGSNDPEIGEDDFIFELDKEEFLRFMFEDWELPNLARTSIKNATAYVNRRAGYSTVGNPSNLNIVKSLEKSIMRRTALRSPLKAEVRELEGQLESETNEFKRAEIQAKIDEMWRRIESVPFIDEFDLRYNAHTKDPIPATAAAMFCLMDISASMGEHEKDLAKRFFYMLYLFLTTKYDKVDIIFISHHTEAKEVTEEEFFYSKETGGTLVSTALVEMDKIIKERYSGAEWNVYGAQCSDGDNWGSDNDYVLDLLRNKIFPAVQYFAYAETQRDPTSMWYNGDAATDLWSAYEAISDEKFAMKRVRDPSDIYPVLSELFKSGD